MFCSNFYFQNACRLIPGVKARLMKYRQMESAEVQAMMKPTFAMLSCACGAEQVVKAEMAEPGLAFGVFEAGLCHCQE